MKILTLIDTFSFPNHKNGTFLTNKEKIEIARYIKEYNFEVEYRVNRDYDTNFCVVQVWGEI